MKDSKNKKLCLLVAATMAVSSIASQADIKPCSLPEAAIIQYQKLQEEKNRRGKRNGRGR
jgi:hypothetical protein